MKNVALLGNPNVGKTTLFNSLTGSNQRVGNWAGVTVDKKEGFFGDFAIVDLPGIYAMDTYSNEEKISKEFLENEKVDLILNIIDASNIDRNLYLTMQLKQFKKPIVLAVNMIDVAEKKGINIDYKKLGELLNVIVVPIQASKEMGIDVGDKIELEVLENGIQKKKTFEVINISQITPDFAFIYQSAFDKGLAKNINSINIKCSDDKKKSIKIEIERMLESKSGNVEFVDCGEELDKNEAYVSAINIIFGIIAGFAIILTIFNSINGSIYEIMSQSADFGVFMAIGISDKQLEEIISKKIEDRVAIPAILGVVLGSIFVFLMSKVLIEVSTIKLNISTPWILYLFIIITAVLSVKIGTKYVCNKMKKMSPTDIINNV